MCEDEHFGALLGGSYDFVLSLATTLKGKSQTRLVLSMDYVFEFSDIHRNISLLYTIDTVHNIFLYVQTLLKYNGNV